MTATSPGSIRFGDHTRGDLRAIAPVTTAVVPIGSIEQHGPHLPVSADTTIVTYVAEHAVLKASTDVPAVLLPTLPFGYAHHHLPFGGTISVSASTYIDTLMDIGKSLAHDGFTRVLFLNGHGGNVNPAAVVVDRLSYEVALTTSNVGNPSPVKVGAMSYWSCAAESLAEIDLDGAPKPGHAGSFETSCLMAIAPQLVRLDRRPPAEPELQPQAAQNDTTATVRVPGSWRASDGRTDDSHAASSTVGEQILSRVVDAVANFIKEFHRG